MSPELTPEAIAEFQPDTFPGDLGIEPLEVSARGARGRIVADRRHLHPGGYVHGGVWVSLADTVAAWATLSNLEPDQGFTTIELKINVFAAGREGDELVAAAEPLHIGKRTQAWEVRVTNGDRLAALFVCTQMVLQEG
ncbi:MAG: PaaI family thioesterase [Thermoleophilaceae bacterium]|nr:PaaI family thioesterase [Thermoleophilaceae bacterium]